MPAVTAPALQPESTEVANPVAQSTTGRSETSPSGVGSSNAVASESQPSRGCSSTASCFVDERVFPLPVEQQVHEFLHPAENFSQSVLSSGQPVTASQVEHLFGLLPTNVADRFGSQGGQTFVSGVYRHGGVVGLTTTCRSLPLSTMLLTKWATASCDGDFTFCSLVLNLNVKTQVHRDGNNDDADNYVLPVSKFVNGHIWVESPGGSHCIDFHGKSVPGVLHDVASGPVRFFAKGQLHCTMPWLGERLVLILYSGGDAAKLSSTDLKYLRSLGFRPSFVTSTTAPPVDFVPHVKPALEPLLNKLAAKVRDRPVHELVFVQVFAGSGGLCAAVRKAGLKLSIGVDNHARRSSMCPMVSLDLTKSGSRAILVDMLRQDNVVACHLSPPVATCNAVPRHTALKQVRSASHPDGVPGIDGSALLLVESSNTLFQFCAEVWLLCWELGVLCSLEHPSRSLMWLTTPLKSCLQTPFLSTSLHQCMFGCFRRKATRILHTCPYLESIGISCDGLHDHEPWAPPGSACRADSAYPPLLCKAFADALVSQLRACGAKASPTALTDASLPLSLGARIAVGDQPSSKRVPPLVPEFSQLVRIQGPAPSLPCTCKTKLLANWPMPASVLCNPYVPDLPAGTKCLQVKPYKGTALATKPLGSFASPSPLGFSGSSPWVLGGSMDGSSSCDRTEIREPLASSRAKDGSLDDDLRESQVARASNVESPDSSLELLLGIPWSPSAFVEQACKAKHPRSLERGVPAGMVKCIEHLCSNDAVAVARARTAELRKWTLRKKELDETFDGPDHCKKVLKSKPTSLFHEMMLAAGHGDTTLVEDIRQGFDLLGPIKPSSVLPKKTTVATLSIDDVRVSTPANQKAIWESTKACRDLGIAAEVHRLTLEERDKGWLSGPFTLDDVPPTAIITRRFGVKQGTTQTPDGVIDKIRPIDDYTESLVNLTNTCSETIEPHSVSVIVSGILLRCKLLRKTRQAASLVMRTIDLRKAYKQLPLSERALQDAYICVLNPHSGEPELFQSQVLPFGSKSSVQGFCRTSYAIWAIGLGLLSLHWSVYFDDYVVIGTPKERDHLDLVLHSFFTLIGWETSAEKDAGFSAVAKALGVEVCLDEIHLGLLKVQNTEARRRELASTIDSLIATGGAHAKELECLRGRLQFAESQVFGRGAVQRMRVLSRALKRVGYVVFDDSLTEALLFLKDRVLHGPPRALRACDYPTYHLFTDASYEQDQPAGMGGILYSQSGLLLRWFSERASLEVLDAINADGKAGLIYELEACAAVQGLLQLCQGLNDCDIICYCDNDAALAALIRCASDAPVVAAQLTKLSSYEDSRNVHVWFERVESAANPSDDPSRFVLASLPASFRCRWSPEEELLF